MKRRVLRRGTVAVDETGEDADWPSTEYSRHFEQPLIEATRAYYAARGDWQLDNGTFFEFANYVSIAQRRY